MKENKNNSSRKCMKEKETKMKKKDKSSKVGE